MACEENGQKKAWNGSLALPLGGDEENKHSKPQPICRAAADLQFQASHASHPGDDQFHGNLSRPGLLETGPCSRCARTLAVHTGDFYANRPAVTVNQLGRGEAYYLAGRTEDKFLDHFYSAPGARLKLKTALETALSHGAASPQPGKESF
jgi:hypothetical protein